MSRKQSAKPFSTAKQQQYEREARLQYGRDTVNRSVQLWNSYAKAQQEIIFEEGGQIYSDLVAALEAGISPQSMEVQAILQRWHEHLRYFYEPTLDILRGLGEGYNADAEFNGFFSKMHPELPSYLQAGITQYVDDLEYAAIERLLASDDDQQADH